MISIVTVGVGVVIVSVGVVSIGVKVVNMRWSVFLPPVFTISKLYQ